MSIIETKKIESFFSSTELQKLKNKILENNNLFRKILPKLGFNLPMSILDGEDMLKYFPEIYELAHTKVKDEMENYLGFPVKLMDDTKRRVRIHRYQSIKEGLMWHLDGADFTALIILENSLGGGTEIIPLRKSWMISILVYVMPFTYFFNSFKWPISLFSPYEVITDQGDMSLLKGGKAVHRATAHNTPGERQVLAISFNHVTKPANRIWDYFAKKLVYE